jgi:alkaline phosphatase
MPDHREDYKVHKKPRSAATKVGDEYYANPSDSVDGFVVNGTLDTTQSQGVHSLTDVPVYAWGPCQETFAGTYNNIDIFYKIANCFGLGTDEDDTDCKSSKRKA